MDLKNVDLAKFKTYKLLVKEGSFAAASKTSGSSYSSLNHDISALEKGLGKTLHYPTKRKFIPTKEGLEILELFDAFLESLNLNGKNQDQPIHQILSIRTDSPFMNFFLNPLICSQLAKDSPSSFKILMEIPDSSISLLDEDILISNQLLTRFDWSTRGLAQFEYIYIAAKDYLATTGEPKSVQDLKAHKLLGAVGLKNQLEDCSKDNVILESNSYQDLLDVCLKGLGILILPSLVFDRLGPALHKKLRVVLPGTLAFEETIYFYYKRFTPNHQPITNFLDALKNQIG